MFAWGRLRKKLKKQGGSSSSVEGGLQAIKNKIDKQKRLNSQQLQALYIGSSQSLDKSIPAVSLSQLVETSTADELAHFRFRMRQSVQSKGEELSLPQLRVLYSTALDHMDAMALLERRVQASIAKYNELFNGSSVANPSAPSSSQGSRGRVLIRAFQTSDKFIFDGAGPSNDTRSGVKRTYSDDDDESDSSDSGEDDVAEMQVDNSSTGDTASIAVSAPDVDSARKALNIRMARGSLIIADTTIYPHNALSSSQSACSFDFEVQIDCFPASTTANEMASVCPSFETAVHLLASSSFVPAQLNELHKLLDHLAQDIIRTNRRYGTLYTFYTYTVCLLYIHRIKLSV